MFIFYLLSFIVEVSAQCNNMNIQNTLCTISISTNSPYKGRDRINITWNRNLFNDFVYIKLVTLRETDSSYICNYNYNYVNYEDNDVHVLSENINNHGYYLWNIPNLNYIHDDYFIQISDNNDVICDSNTNLLNQNVITTTSFDLLPNYQAYFRWSFPRLNSHCLLGNTYYISADGYHHQRRFGYSLRLLASYTNFDSIGTWVQRNDQIRDYRDIENIPNWLSWGGIFNYSFIDNYYTDDHIHIKWIIPTNPNAIIRSNNRYYTLTRENGTILKITDNDVKVKILTRIYEFNIDTNNLTYRATCFDHNNNNVCDSHESYTYSSPIFRIVNNPITSTAMPSISPTAMPTNNPTLIPSNSPTLIPSNSPTLMPTNNPTLIPSNSPTAMPTNNPTLIPSNSPTAMPTNNPTAMPTNNPTAIPTNNPTLIPSNSPTVMPSTNPTAMPTNSPTAMPTNSPTVIPTTNPTMMPTNNPSLMSTNSPTVMPSTYPTITSIYNLEYFSTTRAPQQNYNGYNSGHIEWYYILIIIICILFVVGCVKKKLDLENNNDFIENSSITSIKNRAPPSPIYIDNHVPEPIYNSLFVDTNNHMYNHLTKIYNDIGSSNNINSRKYDLINRQRTQVNTTYQSQNSSNRDSVQYEEINDEFKNDPYYIND